MIWRRRAAFVGMIFFALCFALWNLDLVWLWESTRFHLFQTRDLARAEMLLEGQAIYFGPEMTGGGNLPGPFYYYLLSTALIFQKSWIGAWWLMVGLVVIAAVVGFIYLWRKWDFLSGLLFLILFCGGGLAFHELSTFLNLSYIFLFVLIALIAVNETFSSHSSSHHRGWLFTTACVAVGLSAQLHLSALVMAVPLLAMALFPHRLGVMSLPRKEIAFGLGAFLVTFAPFAYWYGFGLWGVQLGQQPAYASHTASAPEALFELLRNRLPLSSVSWSRPLGMIPIAFWLIILSCAIEHWSARGKRNFSSSFNLALSSTPKPLWMCALSLAAPATLAMFSHHAHRYGVGFLMAISVCLAMPLKTLLAARQRRLIFNCLALTTLILAWIWLAAKHIDALNSHFAMVGVGSLVMSLIALIGFSRGALVERVSWTAAVALITLLTLTGRATHMNVVNRRVVSVNPTLQEWTKMWTQVISATGWDLPTAIHRLYFFRHHVEADPVPSYQLVSHLTKDKGSSSVDGFLIIFGKMRHSVRDWIHLPTTPEEIRSGVESGEIQLLSPMEINPLVIPYLIKPTLSFSRFHNVSQGYLPSEDRKVFEGIDRNEFVHSKGSGQWLLRWNDCATQNPACDIGVIVNLQPGGEGKINLSARIIGEPLAQGSPWILVGVTQAWQDVELAIKCGGAVKTYTLVRAIGYDRELALHPRAPLLSPNSALLAPFEKNWTVSCQQDWESLTVSRGEAKMETIRAVVSLPASSRTLSRPLSRR